MPIFEKPPLETLALAKVVGNYSTQFPDALMTKATDVQHWTFFYRFGGRASEDPLRDPEAKPKPHLSVLAECTQGVFNHFRYSSSAVTHVKSLEYTWVAVSLDNAIANLNANGFIRGFSSVEVLRPDLAQWPDDMVYLFTCPWERREVAISTQTGAMLWSYGY